MYEFAQRFLWVVQLRFIIFLADKWVSVDEKRFVRTLQYYFGVI